MADLFTHIEPQDNYDYLRMRLAAESIADGGALSLFQRIVPKAREAIQSNIEAISGFLAGIKSSAPYSRERATLARALASLDFVAYEDTLVQVPEGFKGKYVPFLELLIAQAPIVNKHAPDMLRDYATQLSVFLTNEDAQTAIRIHSKSFASVRAQREAFTKATDAFFSNKNQAASRARLSDVVSRSSEFAQVFELEQKLSRERDDFEYQPIIAEASRCVDLLATVRERIEDKDIQGVSSAVAKQLSEGAYEVGRYIEYVAIYSYYVESTLSSVRGTAEILTGLLNPSKK